jgi:transposase
VKGLSKKQLLKENQELREENARLRQEVELLRQKMDLLIRRVFGRSSEKLDASQLDLFLMAAENEPGKVDASSLEEADPRHEPRARRDARCRERWPADLPVVEEIIDPKEVQKAPEDWRLIGAEVSEQLDYEPGRFLRRRLVRRKYVRRGDLEAVPVIAALPPSLQERCIAAPGLLAQIIVSKYCDHRVPRARDGPMVPVIRATTRLMRAGPSEPADRSRLQIATGGCGQKPWS